eukprot:6184751-Pleurochrysis_carterae.AAC.1
MLTCLLRAAVRRPGSAANSAAAAAGYDATAGAHSSKPKHAGVLSAQTAEVSTLYTKPRGLPSANATRF